jgi:hypothetical protein
MCEGASFPLSKYAVGWDGGKRNSVTLRADAMRGGMQDRDEGISRAHAKASQESIPTVVGKRQSVSRQINQRSQCAMQIID